MFEKKKKKLILLDKLPSSYEDVSDNEKKRACANRLYSISRDKMMRFNSVTGVFSEIEDDSYIGTVTKEYLKQEIFMQNVKLFIDSNATVSARLPESLIVKHKEENDGDV